MRYQNNITLLILLNLFFLRVRLSNLLYSNYPASYFEVINLDIERAIKDAPISTEPAMILAPSPIYTAILSVPSDLSAYQKLGVIISNPMTTNKQQAKKK